APSPAVPAAPRSGARVLRVPRPPGGEPDHELPVRRRALLRQARRQHRRAGPLRGQLDQHARPAALAARDAGPLRRGPPPVREREQRGDLRHPRRLLDAGARLAGVAARRLRARVSPGGSVGGPRRRRARRLLPAADPLHGGAALRAARGVPRRLRLPRARARRPAARVVGVRARGHGARRGGPHPRRPHPRAVRGRRPDGARGVAPPPQAAAGARARRPRRGGGARRAGALEPVRVGAQGLLRAGHHRVVLRALRRHLPARQRHDGGDEARAGGGGQEAQPEAARHRGLRPRGALGARRGRRAPPRAAVQPGGQQGGAAQHRALRQGGPRRLRADDAQQGAADVDALCARRRPADVVGHPRLAHPARARVGRGARPGHRARALARARGDRAGDPLRDRRAHARGLPGPLQPAADARPARRRRGRVGALPARPPRPRLRQPACPAPRGHERAREQQQPRGREADGDLPGLLAGADPRAQALV
ncbi:MAG: hypothetical protein AVDCRST_MAG30-4421, partial [uncultured Solirubrobacteraceae bacterium]